MDILYLKTNIGNNLTFYKINFSDKNFYKGVSICFNREQTELKQIIMDHWLDYKAAKYILSDSNKSEFNEAINKAISMINKKK